MTEPLLSVSNLTKTFSSGPPWQRRHVQAVRGVSFDLPPGRTLGLVGESGSGKSTTGRLVARLIEPSSGQILFDGEDVTQLRGERLKAWRKEVGFIFQDPYGSLDARMTIEQIVTEPLLVHREGTASERRRKAAELIDEVELPSTALAKYPHEFSGGQRQRIAIARAIALRPRLLIADEPVSALDVSVQAAVLNLFKDLRERHDLAYVFISHDLDVVEYMSEEIAVMYLGEIVEQGHAGSVLHETAHPYSRALWDAAPTLEVSDTRHPPRLRGEIPSADNPPPGCVFHTRCPMATDLCRTEVPPVVARGEHWGKCHFAFQTSSTAPVAGRGAGMEGEGGR